MGKSRFSAAEDDRQSLLTFRLATVALILAVGLAIVAARKYELLDCVLALL